MDRPVGEDDRHFLSVDGTAVDRSLRKLRLDPGEHTIEVGQMGEEPRELLQPVKKALRKATVKFNFAPAKTYYLHVNAKRVYKDGTPATEHSVFDFLVAIEVSIKDWPGQSFLGAGDP